MLKNCQSLHKMSIGSSVGKLLSSFHFISQHTLMRLVVIVYRCHEVTKRDAVVEFWCEMEDSFYYGEIKLNLVSATLFKKMYPPSPNNDKVSYNHNPYSYKAPRLSDSCLKIKESFNDSFVDDWITIDASIDGVKSCDCIGHFYEGGAVSTRSRCRVIIVLYSYRA